MERKAAQLWRSVLSFMLIAAVVLTLAEIPAQAGSVVEEIEYNGNGRVGVEFNTDIVYPSLKIVVKTAAGKSLPIRITRKSSRVLRIIVSGFKQGQAYTVTVSGIRRKCGRRNLKVSGKIYTPTYKGCVQLKNAEYDIKDREVEFIFSADVEYRNPRITIKRGSTSYFRKINKKERREIEVSVKALKKGRIYTFTITGIRKKGAKKFGSISGTFRY